MRRLLELFHMTGQFRLLRRELVERADTDGMKALTVAGILRPDGVATHYPCDGGVPGCRRRILPPHGGPGQPRIAVCGTSWKACPNRWIPVEELEQFSASHEDLASALQLLMRLEGSLAPLGAAYPETTQIGTLYTGEGARDVFLSVGLGRFALRTLLAERMRALHRSLVLVPTNVGMPPELVHQHAPGEHVTLGFLIDVLGSRSGDLALLPAFHGLLRRRTDAGSVFCVLYEPKGTRLLSSAEYEEVVSRASEFDLFIDGVMPREGRHFLGSRREPGKDAESVLLSSTQVDILVELVSKQGAAVQARDLAALRTTHPQSAVRIVEMARSSVDVRTSSRLGWRAFQTIASGQYAFRPSLSVDFAVLGRLRP